MSRIGRLPISVPESVKVEIGAEKVKVIGPKGELSRRVPSEVILSLEDHQVVVKPKSDSRNAKSAFGLTRTLVANMVQGVTEGFSKILELSGVGFRASVTGGKLVLNVGYSHPVEINPPEGIDFNVKDNTKIVVSGTNKELVGEVAAKIREVRKPEPYKGKGIKYQGEVVRRKAGKAGKAGATGGK
jgi:large subunit ribosomal protein L6